MEPLELGIPAGWHYIEFLRCGEGCGRLLERFDNRQPWRCPCGFIQAGKHFLAAARRVDDGR